MASMSLAKLVLVLPLVAASSLAHAQTAVSPEIKRLLDTEAWQLDLEITFAASASGSAQGLHGPVDYQSTLSVEYAESIPLDVRSPGASLSMQKLASKASNPADAAQMQKAMMDLVMQTDSITSWLTGGQLSASLDENASDAEARAAVQAAVGKELGSLKLDYSAQTRGDKLFDEMGSPYKQIVHTTRRGTAPVPFAGQQIMFELNAATQHVLLLLPPSLGAAADATYTEEVVTTTESPPGAAPVEERKTEPRPFSLFPGSLKLMDSASADALWIDDPIALAGGKISGQHSTKATYNSAGTPVPGTLITKYTLTPR